MGKYDQYFLYQTPPSPLHASGNMPWTPLFRVDDRVLPEAFYFECIWITGPIPESKAFKPHSHDADEYLGFIGTDPGDPFNLFGEVNFWLEDEMHVITRTCLVFIRKGLFHSPIIIPRLEKPIFCLSTAPASRYGQNISSDPRWAHLPDPPEGKWSPGERK